MDFASCKMDIRFIVLQHGQCMICLMYAYRDLLELAGLTTRLDKNGTKCKLTIYDTPSQNGIAERLNCTLIEKVHAVMISSQLPHFLWGKALLHVIWLKNRMWTRALLKGVTLYELVIGNTPVLCDIPEWGSIVWVHV
jgi:hypothetical protein